MATETANGLTGHPRSVAVTTIAALGGVVAGVVSSMLATSATDTIGIAVVLAAALVELGIMRVIGVDIAEFGTKDHLYIIFMTFALWFVTWGILLTSGV